MSCFTDSDQMSDLPVQVDIFVMFMSINELFQCLTFMFKLISLLCS